MALLLLGPWLGVLADRGKSAVRMLAICTWLGVLATMLLGLLPALGHVWALVLFVISTCAFLLGNIFYDTLLVEVSSSNTRERISAYGYAFGYLGGGSKPCMFPALPRSKRKYFAR